MIFPGPDGDATQNNLGLLPCRNAEIVIQTRNSSDDAEDGDVSQLVVQCKLLLLLSYLCIPLTLTLFFSWPIHRSRWEQQHTRHRSKRRKRQGIPPQQRPHRHPRRRHHHGLLFRPSSNFIPQRYRISPTPSFYLLQRIPTS
jgi:hypothetical protein